MPREGRGVEAVELLRAAGEPEGGDVRGGGLAEDGGELGAGDGPAPEAAAGLRNDAEPRLEALHEHPIEVEEQGAHIHARKGIAMAPNTG